MKSITVFTNFNIPDKAEIAADVIRRFTSLGVSVTVPGHARAVLHGLPVQYVPTSHIYDDTEMAVVIGGDGTILDTARRVCERNIPILGINKGRLGYMTELEVSETEMIERVVRGEWHTDERSMLSIEVRNGEDIVYSGIALNDAVLTNGSVARLIDYKLCAGNSVLGDYRSDGIIFSTPTGSTAYSLSAGGPIIDPQLKVICVTFICAHSLNARPMVFSDNTEIRFVNTCNREPFVFLTLDGHFNFRVYRNQTVTVTHSDKTTKLVRVKNEGSYSDIYNKLKVI